MLLAVFAFLSGLATVASPCVLPVLPMVLATSVGAGRWRPGHLRYTHFGEGNYDYNEKVVQQLLSETGTASK